MRVVAILAISLVTFGCAASEGADSIEMGQEPSSAQSVEADYPEGLDHTGRPSEDAPKVGEDFRAQENGAAEAKIVGGTKVEIGEFLDTVGVGSLSEEDASCTGILIEPDVVLTAAHCAKVGISGRVYVGDDRENWQAEYEVSGVEHGLMPQHVPSDCDPVRLKCALDIAVLVLKEPMNDARPRALASSELIDNAISFRAVGFGRMDRNARVISRYKREARITSVSNDCSGIVRGGTRRPNRTDEEVYGCEPSREIVAGQMRGRTDTCNGDSGGPLLVGPQGTGQASSNDDFLLAGLTSRPTSQSRTACGDGGVYERLDSAAQSWIAGAVGRLRAQRERQN